MYHRLVPWTCAATKAMVSPYSDLWFNQREVSPPSRWDTSSSSFQTSSYDARDFWGRGLGWILTTNIANDSNNSQPFTHDLRSPWLILVSAIFHSAHELGAGRSFISSIDEWYALASAHVMSVQRCNIVCGVSCGTWSFIYTLSVEGLESRRSRIL